MKVGVIGAGWLGGAIAESLVRAGMVRWQDLSLSRRRPGPSRFPEARWTTDNQALADRSDVILLCVRPADWAPLAVDAGGRLVISVMAGIRLDRLARRHNTDRVVRSLPNAAAGVGKSYTPWIGSPGVTAADRALVRRILETCGEQDEVAGETEIDYLTGLTGSGPAFPALLAAAMMRHAVAQGVAEDVARRAVNTVLIGAGRLLERRDDPPEATVAEFLGYRGTTAAAIEAMRAAGFDRAIAEGLEAALRKSVSLGDAS